MFGRLKKDPALKRTYDYGFDMGKWKMKHFFEIFGVHPKDEFDTVLRQVKIHDSSKEHDRAEKHAEVFCDNSSEIIESFRKGYRDGAFEKFKELRG